MNDVMYRYCTNSEIQCNVFFFRRPRNSGAELLACLGKTVKNSWRCQIRWLLHIWLFKNDCAVFLPAWVQYLLAKNNRSQPQFGGEGGWNRNEHAPTLRYYEMVRQLNRRGNASRSSGPHFWERAYQKKNRVSLMVVSFLCLINYCPETAYVHFETWPLKVKWDGKYCPPSKPREHLRATHP